MLMVMTPEGRQVLTEAFEGWSPEAYSDITGVTTQGCGHTNAAGVPFISLGDPPWTQPYGDTVLANDLSNVENFLSNVIAVPLSRHQADAVIDWAYNVGEGNVESSTLLRLLNQNDLHEAAGQFPRWDYANGQIAPGLTRRRLAEQAWFLGEPMPPQLEEVRTQAHLIDNPSNIMIQLFNRAMLRLAR